MRNNVKPESAGTFAERLDEALDDASERGLGLREIAVSLELSSPSRLSEWRKGQGAPPYDLVKDLAGTLGVEVAWLVAGTHPKHGTPVDVRVDAYHRIAAVVDKVRAGAGDAAVRGREAVVCQRCRTTDHPVRRSKGSFALELFLWFLFIVPGLCYSLWRWTAGRVKVCRTCGSEDIVPISSPVGRDLSAR